MASVSGGDKLGPALEAIAQKLDNASMVRMGFIDSKTYPDGTSIAMVAAIQNFGAPARGIPPRPFFSNMVATKSKGWSASLGLILKQQRYDARKSLTLMGIGMKEQLEASIDQTNSPPLNPKTVARKGFAKPLVDTGLMRNSISSEVT